MGKIFNRLFIGYSYFLRLGLSSKQGLGQYLYSGSLYEREIWRGKNGGTKEYETMRGKKGNPMQGCIVFFITVSIRELTWLGLSRE